MDTGLFLLRVVAGLLLAGHGAQKLFGWFGGPGLEGASGFLSSLGYRRPRPLAATQGLAELGGGLSLALGLLTPLGAAAIIGMMVNAIGSAHWSKGLWATRGGYEYPLVLLTLAAALAFTGPGAVSVDAAAGLAAPVPETTLLALLLGFTVGFVVLATRRVEAGQAREGERRTA